jgi:hypothetical protein
MILVHLKIGTILKFSMGFFIFFRRKKDGAQHPPHEQAEDMTKLENITCTIKLTFNGASISFCSQDCFSFIIFTLFRVYGLGFRI